MSRFSVAGVAFAAAACAATLAHAAPIQPFTSAALAAAQAQGLAVLVDVHADWCPTCRAQAPTISGIAKDPAFAKLVILKLDYDKQVTEERALGVRQQSTLIAFKGRQETGRLVGVTDAAQIRALAGGSLR
jgi:thiol-disulfide isomerase/thioredoxin